MSADASKPASVPASAPIGSVILGAALVAVQAIQPLAVGQAPNYALMAATFLVTFGGALGLALYHVQLPSAVQAEATAALTGAIETMAAHVATHPAELPAVSTDHPTAP